MTKYRSVQTLTRNVDGEDEEIQVAVVYTCDNEDGSIEVESATTEEDGEVLDLTDQEKNDLAGAVESDHDAENYEEVPEPDEPATDQQAQSGGNQFDAPEDPAQKPAA